MLNINLTAHFSEGTSELCLHRWEYLAHLLRQTLEFVYVQVEQCLNQSREHYYGTLIVFG